MKISIIGLALILLVAVAPHALANKSSAIQAVAEARALIRAAQRSGADSFARTELKTAEDLFSNAQASMDKRKWNDAEIVAKKAQRDAELASTKTQALKAEQALAEMQRVVDALKGELKRQGGM